MNYLDFSQEEDKDGLIYHDFVAPAIQLRKTNEILRARGEPELPVTEGNIPHEWFMIEKLQNSLHKDPTLADKFAMFVCQCYPDFVWSISSNELDWSATIELEAWLANKVFEEKFNGFPLFGDELDQAIRFGDMATDFEIRYLGKSLVKTMGQKIIQTAHSNCHKRFEHLLKDGYSIYRTAKMRYVEGVFHKNPVLPTRDVGYPIKEVIEAAD